MKQKIIIVLIAVGVMSGATVFYVLNGDQPAVVNTIVQPTYLERRVEAAFKPVPCPKTPRTFPAGAYTGPLYDMHVHIASIPDGGDGPVEDPGDRLTLGVNTSIEDYVCMMDVEGTAKALAFFPIWDPLRPMLDVVRGTMAKYPDRFIPFIMSPDDDGSPTGFPTVDATTLTSMLGVYPGLFRGYGEIGLYARDGGAPELPPDSQRLMEIYPVIRQNQLLVYFHLGQGHKDEFEKVLAANPDITFIFHGDQLVADAGDSGDNLTLIDDVLSNHSNVYYGIDELYGDVFILRRGVAKQTFIDHFKDPEPLLQKDLKTWARFINKHPDQVLWDTDRGGDVRWALDPDVAIVLNDYSRLFIGRLDPVVQEKFAYKNAAALIHD